MSSDGEFSLVSARPRHSGVYQCVAQAEGEEVVREVTLSVNCEYRGREERDLRSLQTPL